MKQCGILHNITLYCILYLLGSLCKLLFLLGGLFTKDNNEACLLAMTIKTAGKQLKIQEETL